jgi:hypothetical protein
MMSVIGGVPVMGSGMLSKKPLHGFMPASFSILNFYTFATLFKDRYQLQFNI